MSFLFTKSTNTFLVLKISLLFLVLNLIVSSCNNVNKDIYKNEILKTEKDFADTVAAKGMMYAFLLYADTDAVINRNNQLFKGGSEIRSYFEKILLEDVQLEWSPDFIDVSNSGDLGYSYGSYSFSATDSVGNKLKSEGIFHTVWKKQSDGSWKFVWD